MPTKINIVCLEDQREVLNAIVDDLAPFSEAFVLEECESAREAKEVLQDIYSRGEALALLISDHVMPGQSGIDFLIDLHADKRFPHTRKLLLTGLATHQDTIEAINRAAIDRYLSKPWDAELLREYVGELVTLFILDAGIDYQPYLRWLNQELLYQKLRER